MNALSEKIFNILPDSIGEYVSSDLIYKIIVAFLLFFLITVFKQAMSYLITKRKLKGETLFKSTLNWTYFFTLFILLIINFSDLSILNRTILTIGGSNISILLILIVLFIIIFSVKLSEFIRSYLMPPAYDRYKLDVGTRFTFNSIVHYFILVIAIFVSLNTIGINLTSITIFAGIFGVGLGFGMQNIVSNFISGIILLFERPIKVGDRVVVDGVLGEVLEIKIRATIVRTFDNEHIIVPNSFFLEERIVNKSYGDLSIRTVVDVGVSYSSDVKLVEKLLIEAVDRISAKTGRILRFPETFVRFIAFGDSSLDFKLFVWVDEPNSVYLVRSELHFEILELFRANGVEIPFPQRDVHMFDN